MHIMHIHFTYTNHATIHTCHTYTCNTHIYISLSYINYTYPFKRTLTYILMGG